jgi:hypothetical protein
MTNEEILGAFKSNMLIARPTFSLRTAIRTHLLQFVAGSALMLAGFLGLFLPIRQARRKPQSAIST